MVFVSKGRVKLVCPQCKQEFVTFLSIAKRPGTHCCCWACEIRLHPRKPRLRVVKQCLNCGKDFEVAVGRKNKASYCSRPCANIYQRGENAANYKHGKSDLPRRNSRKVILQCIAAHGCCARCGATDNLQGHHIKSYAKFPDLRNEPTNIEVLCGNCHATEHPAWANMIARPRIRSGKTHACVVCNAPFYVKPSHEKYGRRCCSNECARKIPNRKKKAS